MLVHTAALYAQQHHAEIAQAVAIFAGFLASHATAFLTHEHASAKVKTTVALVLGTLAGVVASVGWAPGQPWYDWVKAILFAIIASHATWALKAVTGVEATQKVGLNLGAPATEPAPEPEPKKAAKKPVV